MESRDGTLDKQLLNPHEMIQRIHMIKKRNILQKLISSPPDVLADSMVDKHRDTGTQKFTYPLEPLNTHPQPPHTYIHLYTQR